MKSNFHTHTKRCCHAFGVEVDYAKEAYDKGLSVLGFSDHAPFKDVDYGYRMQFSELPKYISAVQTERERYAGKMRILTGLEIEYLPKYCEYYEWLLNDMKLDYLALGEHFFNTNGRFCSIFGSESTNEYIPYAKAISEALKTGYFSVLVHPDIMFMNCFAWDKNCDKACEIIVDAAMLTNTPVEYNANGIRRGQQDYPDGRRDPYPHPKFWAMAKDAGLKTLIGSDAHSPEQVYDESMELAVKRAKDFGLDIISEF
ncbi:histidinol-phosphatase [Candidatus Pseudoruminococcus sp.]|uniref:histidinol-phosphatase n=1 Tax=Candidatus Pseudoruminococcus sp. TaxID=3101048 RepID=UPI00399BE3F6